MDAIEQAIRNAFAKGDPADPAFREKVYRWAYSVVDKTIASKPDLTPEDAERQRRRALAAIEKVESEFQPAAEPAAPAPPMPPPPPAPEVSPEVRVEPPVEDAAPAAPEVTVADVRAVDAGRQEPVVPMVGADVEAPHAPAPDWPDVATSDSAASAHRLAGDPEPGARARPAATAAEERPRRRFPWGLLMGLAIVAIVAVLAIWAAAELGLVRLQSGGPAMSDGAPSGEAAAPGSDAALEEWIVVFSPSDPTTVRAPEGASAEVIDTGDSQALRISSGSSGAAVVFDIGQGVLERLAGRHAIFDIVARTGDGPETQMSVTCNLGELGECGRNRYTVGKQPSEYLFEVDVPDGAPGAGGTIAISSDVDNGGKAVEIVEIRVTAAPGR